MSEHDQREPSGISAAVFIVILLIAALAAGAFLLVYRQARAAREQAVVQRMIAEQREQEVRQMAQLQMKALADLEEKETAGSPAAPSSSETPPAAPAAGDTDADKVAPAPTDAATIAKLHTDLAESYLKIGDRAKALDQFKAAHEALKLAYGADDPRTRAAEDRLKKAENPGE